MNIRIQVRLTLCVRSHSSGCANEKQPLCIPISSQQNITDEESVHCATGDEAAHFPGFTRALRNAFFFYYKHNYLSMLGFQLLVAEFAIPVLDSDRLRRKKKKMLVYLINTTLTVYWSPSSHFVRAVTL